MTKTIAEWNVTQEYIDVGTREDPYECPVALGGREYFVVVHADYLVWGDARYHMTPDLRGWVWKYDHGERDVQPITVALFMQDGTRFAGISKG